MGDGCTFSQMLNQGTRELAQVLTPFLGRVMARERSETMARALLDGRGDPLSVATELLPELPAERRRRAAGRVALTWLALRG
jgi:hypothetical protein